MSRTPNLLSIYQSLSSLDENDSLIPTNGYPVYWEGTNCSVALSTEQKKHITHYTLLVNPTDSNSEVVIRLEDIEIVDIYNEHSILFHVLFKSSTDRLQARCSIYRQGDVDEDANQGNVSYSDISEYAVARSGNFTSPETAGRSTDTVSLKLKISGHNGRPIYITYPCLINVYGWSANNFVQNARTQYLPHFYWDIDQQQDPEYPFYKLLDVLTSSADQALVKYRDIFQYSLGELPVSADGLEDWANSSLVNPLHVSEENLPWLSQFSGNKLRNQLTSAPVDIELFKYWQTASRIIGMKSGSSESLIATASLGLCGRVSSIDSSINGRIVAAQRPIRSGITIDNVSRSIWQFDYDGSYDHAVDDNQGSGFNNDINVVRVQPDGKIICGGIFNSVNGTSRIRIARLNLDGTLDTSLDTSLTYSGIRNVSAIASGTPTAGSVRYTTSQQHGFSVGDSVNIAGLAPSGYNGTYTITSIPSTTTFAVANATTTSPTDSSGTATKVTTFGINDIRLSGTDIITAGSFAGSGINYVRKHTSTGADVSAFNSNISTNINNIVNCLYVQDDGKVIIGGTFTTPSPYISRLNADGTVDATFSTNVANVLNGSVHGVGVQSDGKIVAVGEFTKPTRYVCRLTSTGEEDHDFSVNFGNTIEPVDYATTSAVTRLIGKRANLCTNPSFENNTTGWGGAGATIARTAGTITGGVGSWSLVSTATITTGNGAYFGYFAVIPGNTITASVSCLRLSGTRTYSARIEFNKGATFLSAATGTTQACATSTRLTVTGTVPATATVAYVTVYSNTGGAVGDQHQIDALLIEYAPTGGEYFDGSTLSSWAGTPHGSISKLPGIIRTNLIDNPSFETNTTGWNTANLTLARITTDFYVGSASLEITSASATDTTARAGQTTNWPVTAGLPYAGSVWLKNTAGNNRDHLISFRWVNSGGGIVSETLGTATTLNVGGAWQRFTLTDTAPATAVSADLLIYPQNTNPSLSNVTLADACIVEQSSTVGEYFDGSTSTVASWTGTANNSTSTLSGRANLCTNPSFETDTTGWSSGASTTLARITSDSYVGGASLQITASSAVDTTARIRPSPEYSVTAGLTYSASAYVKATAGNNRNIQIALSFHDSVGATLLLAGGTITPFTVGGAWTRLEVTATAPTNTVGVRIFIYHQLTNPSLTNVALVDAILLEQSATVGDYFDGSTSPYMWSDYANASISVTAPNDDDTNRSNICPNPSFETNATSWTSAQTGGVTRSTSFYNSAVGGLASGLVTMSSTTDSNVFSLAAGTVAFPLRGDYTVSAYIYIPTGSTLAGRTVEISFEGGTLTNTGGTSVPATLVANSWVRCSYYGRNFSTGAGTSPAIVFRLSGTLSTASGQTIYIDNCLIERTSLVNTYIDGSSSGYSWSGTTNNSTSIFKIDGSALTDGDRVLVKNQELTNTITNVEPGQPLAGKVQFTTGSAHGFSTGDYVTIANIVPGQYNQRYVITAVPTTTTFIVDQLSSTTPTVISGSVTGRSEQNGVYDWKAYQSRYVRSSDIDSDSEILDLPKIYVLGGTSNAGSFWELNPDNTNFTLGEIGITPSASSYSIDEAINAVAIDGDDKIIIGGAFTTPSNRLARLLDDGNLDTRFNNNIQNFYFGTASSNEVTSLFTDNSNDVYVGGEFYPEVKKINSDGTLNTPVSTQIIKTITDLRSVAILPIYKDDPWRMHIMTLARETADTDAAASITAAARNTPSSGSVRYTTSSAHNFIAGDTVTVRNLSPSTYNGTFTITAKTATTFDVSNASPAGSTTDANGTASRTSNYVSELIELCKPMGYSISHSSENVFEFTLNSVALGKLSKASLG